MGSCLPIGHFDEAIVNANDASINPSEPINLNMPTLEANSTLQPMECDPPLTTRGKSTQNSPGVHDTNLEGIDTIEIYVETTDNVTQITKPLLRGTYIQCSKSKGKQCIEVATQKKNEV